MKPAGASDSLRQILIRQGWVARIQAGAVLTPEQALDAVAWVCAEGSLHSSLHEAHVAEDFWADIAAGRRSPPWPGRRRGAPRGPAYPAAPTC
ncbi:hypothetical protein GCM10017714_10810 [Curtobacterium pusillum]|nr:hypothetical protein GCM10017610_06260 [Curtobacterium pusillum]